MAKIKNFSRFYALLKNIPGNSKDLKEQLCLNFSGNRTASLRELTPQEYNALCAALEREPGNRLSEAAHTAQIKAKRSAVLKRIQKMGIDTTDFAKVDEFCLQPRIAGKVFRHLTIDDLEKLIPKLESILRKDQTRQVSDHLMTGLDIEGILRLTENQIPS